MNFWSLNALAIQPGYAFCREALRYLAERMLSADCERRHARAPARDQFGRRRHLSCVVAVAIAAAVLAGVALGRNGGGSVGCAQPFCRRSPTPSWSSAPISRSPR